MARSRNIKPSFFMNEDIIELPYEARLLFIGLWTLADREGRLENRPKKIKMSLFPADDINVAEQLENISKFGFIELYNADGIDVIHIVNFVKHQNPHGLEKDSELPDRNGIYTVYERNPKNKTIVGKPIQLNKADLKHFYDKTGPFAPQKKHEIETNPEYASVKAYMQKNPNASKEDIARVLGTKYVRWAYGQTKLRNGKSFDYRPHLEKEYKYRANIDKTVQEQKTNLPKENTPAVSDLKSSHIVENTRAKVASVLSTQKAIVPQATTKAKPSLNNQNRLLTNVTPFKQPLNTPNPQEVVVVNGNNGNISQNVNDRFLAHALTGGIGMGNLEG
ncbi:hypothetical protein JIM23_002436 [Acinetobacter baumannii]